MSTITAKSLLQRNYNNKNISINHATAKQINNKNLNSKSVLSINNAVNGSIFIWTKRVHMNASANQNCFNQQNKKNEDELLAQFVSEQQVMLWQHILIFPLSYIPYPNIQLEYSCSDQPPIGRTSTTRTSRWRAPTLRPFHGVVPRIDRGRDRRPITTRKAFLIWTLSHPK